VADEVVIQTWCDICMAEELKTTGEPYRINGSRVDLCTEHAGPITTALGLVEKYGWIDKSPAKAAKAPSQALEASRAAPGTLRCPECGKHYKGPQGLGSHRRRAHGILGAFHNRTA